jgi:hypothetical protein
VTTGTSSLHLRTKMKNKPTTKSIVSSDFDLSDDDGDVPLDEVVSADEELRPRQKIEVDDKVLIPLLVR